MQSRVAVVEDNSTNYRPLIIATFRGWQLTGQKRTFEKASVVVTKSVLPDKLSFEYSVIGLVERVQSV